jgi:hypothetical protein
MSNPFPEHHSREQADLMRAVQIVLMFQLPLTRDSALECQCMMHAHPGKSDLSARLLTEPEYVRQTIDRAQRLVQFVRGDHIDLLGI